MSISVRLRGPAPLHPGMEDERRAELPEAMVVVPAFTQRRRDIRMAPRYRRTAAVIALASIAIPYATGWWIVFLPMAVVALIVLGVGRARAHAAAGVHEPVVTAGDVAKHVAVVGGVAAGSSFLMLGIVSVIITIVVGAFGAMFADCRCDVPQSEGYRSNR